MHFIVAREWNIFQANPNTKHLQICTKHVGLWLFSFKHYYVIIGWIPAWPVPCHSNILHPGGPGWIIIMLLFFSMLQVRIRLCIAQGFGLAQTWITWIKMQNAHKSYLKCMEFTSMTKPSQAAAISDKKILTNQVQKIRFNAACWSNHHYYVTCGCHWKAVSYFVLWHFLICPTSSWRFLWLNKLISSFVALHGCELKTKVYVNI